MKRVAIYLRVSTSKQDTDNQRRELEAVAARSGWHVERVYEDTGISGAKGRDKCPGLDAMLKAVREGVRHGRGLVGRPPRPIVDGSARHPAASLGRGRWCVRILRAVMCRSIGADLWLAIVACPGIMLQ